MAEFISINLSGDLELRRALKSLTPALEKKALRTALRTAAKPILATARANAPKTQGTKHPDRPPPGTLRKSIKIRAFKRTRKGRVGFSIGMGSKDYVGKAFYGSFQEYGWKQGKRPWRGHTSTAQIERRIKALTGILGTQADLTLKRRKQLRRYLQGFEKHLEFRRTGDTRRQIPGKFFIRRAYDTHKFSTRDNMRRLILEAVDKTVQQEAAKQSKRRAA